MKYQIAVQNDRVVIKAFGDLSLLTARGLDGQIDDLINKGYSNFIFDLSMAKSIDSYVIGCMIRPVIFEGDEMVNKPVIITRNPFIRTILENMDVERWAVVME